MINTDLSTSGIAKAIYQSTLQKISSELTYEKLSKALEDCICLIQDVFQIVINTLYEYIDDWLADDEDQELLIPYSEIKPVPDQTRAKKESDASHQESIALSSDVTTQIVRQNPTVVEESSDGLQPGSSSLSDEITIQMDEQNPAAVEEESDATEEASSVASHKVTQDEDEREDAIFEEIPQEPVTITETKYIEQRQRVWSQHTYTWTLSTTNNNRIWTREDGIQANYSENFRLQSYVEPTDKYRCVCVLANRGLKAQKIVGTKPKNPKTFSLTGKWVQSFQFDLRDFLQSDTTNFTFTIFDVKRFDAEKMKAEKKGEESVKICGSQLTAKKVHLTLASRAKRGFWDGYLWYSENGDVLKIDSIPKGFAKTKGEKRTITEFSYR